MKRIFIAIFVLLSFFVFPLSANRDWVTFKSLKAGSLVEIVVNNKPTKFHLQYWDEASSSWKNVSTNASFQTKKTLAENETMLLRGHNPDGLQKVESNVQKFIKIKVTGKVDITQVEYHKFMDELRAALANQN